MDPLMLRSALYALALHLPLLGGFYLLGKDFNDPGLPSVEVVCVKVENVLARKEVPIRREMSSRQQQKNSLLTKKSNDSSATRVQKAGNGGAGLRILKRVDPIYPETARAQGIMGTVLIALTVEMDGTVGGTHVQETSGHVALDQAALTAVAQWRFQPPHQSVTAVIPVRFWC